MRQRTVVVIQNTAKKGRPQSYRLSLREGFEEVDSMDIEGSVNLGFHIANWLVKGKFFSGTGKGAREISK